MIIFFFLFFFFNDTATTEIYTLSLHDALPIYLPNANVNKTRQQLYGLNVLPDNMGGDTPFVETSAATGKGIDELLDQLSVVAELKELKANPNRPAEGTCLEAKLDPQEGVQATLLVQSGTLRPGDVILCGASFGRVRALYDD